MNTACSSEGITLLVDDDKNTNDNNKTNNKTNDLFKVESDRCRYLVVDDADEQGEEERGGGGRTTRNNNDVIVSDYAYETTVVETTTTGNNTAAAGGTARTTAVVRPVVTKLQFRTDRTVPKLGVMLIGLGGNNGWYVQYIRKKNESDVARRDVT